MSQHVRSLHIIDSPNAKDFYTERREGLALKALLELRPDANKFLINVHTVVNREMLRDAIAEAAQGIRNILIVREALEAARRARTAPAPALAPQSPPAPVPIQEDEYYPILHFSCHAEEDYIQLTSGEQLPWDQLRQDLEPFAQETAGKLLLCFSACKSIHAEAMLTGDPKIFDVLVAPTAKLDADETLLGFATFYHFFLTKGCTLRHSVRLMNLALIGSREPVTFEFRPADLGDKKLPTARRVERQPQQAP